MHPLPHHCHPRNEKLGTLIKSDINAALMRGAIRRLHRRFATYITTCPAPIPTSGLAVSTEIRLQSELYLPISEITAVFYHFYRSVLTYSPILSSTPFHNALSWADVFVALPPHFQFSANPAQLLESLLADHTLLTRFLFASFLPPRFYGGFGRYPEQQKFIKKWLRSKNVKTVRCLDAACGTGEGTYGLAHVLKEQGFSPEDADIEGWTVEPMEVWVAEERCFPHDPQREAAFRKSTPRLSQCKIRFSCSDLANPKSSKQFDLILCNGLLGGPIIHRIGEVERMVENLTALLAPGGILLAADRFHGGWKRHCPQMELQAVLERHGLEYVAAGEGIGGLKL